MTDDTKRDDLTPDEDSPEEPSQASGPPSESGAEAEESRPEPDADDTGRLHEEETNDAGETEPEVVDEPESSGAASTPVTAAAVAGAGRSDGGRAPGTAEGEEAPYVDDPVSRWWVGLIIAVFVVIFAWAFFFGRGGLLIGDPDDPASTPSPAATTSASPSPSADASPSASPSPRPEPTPTPEPTLEPTPTPRPTPMPEPTPMPTPEPVPTPTPVPVVPASTTEPTLAPCPTVEPGPGSPSTDPPLAASPAGDSSPLPCRTPEPTASPTG